MDDDDVWGDGDDSEDHAAELEREWRVRREAFWKEGYREGIEVGKAETIQQGFDAGYQEGIEASRRWGQLSGAAHVLHGMRGKLGPEAALKVEALHQMLALPPRDVMLSIAAETLAQPNPTLPGNPGTAAPETAAAPSVSPAPPEFPMPSSSNADPQSNPLARLPEVEVSSGISSAQRHAIMGQAEALLQQLGFAAAVKGTAPVGANAPG